MEEDYGWLDIASDMCQAEVDAGIRKFCPKCGQELKPGSINYFEGFHIDGCD
jgi:hypothetical protein